MVTGLISNYAKSSPEGKDNRRDPTGLGRWCLLMVEGSCGPVQLVAYYRPHGLTKTEADIAKGLREPKDTKKASLSAWAQQKRYYKAKGMMNANPRTEADSDLLHQLQKWKLQNDEIILMVDFNQNIYTSNVAQQLAADDLGMEEQYHKLHGGEQAPFSYVMGTEPIMGCFATGGIFVKSYFMAVNGASGSVEDHRLHVIDFCAVSILGVELLVATKQAGRRLQYNLKPTSRKYRKDLVKMCKRHRIKEKALVMSRAENARENFDRQHTELQIACEKKAGNSESADQNTLHCWPRSTDICQKNYKWIQDFKERPQKTPDTRNLEQACRNNGIECPHKMSVQQAIKGQHECAKEMEAIRSRAPHLREEYLAESHQRVQLDTL